MFRPSEAGQMTTPCKLQTPVAGSSYGVNTKTWKDVDGVIMANFKSFGGTEKIVNGILTVEDTAQFVCFYRPEIKAGCRMVILDGNENTKNPTAYEILGKPENIENRNQFLKFKGICRGGGA